MNTDLVLCRQLASPRLVSVLPTPEDCLEWYDGPVIAVVRCPSCDSAALVVMLDWSRRTGVRIFAMAALDPAAFALFQRNCERGSCDASRLASEWHALWATAGAAERLLAVDVATGEVLVNVPHPGVSGLPTEPWTERLPPEHDTRWFELVKLAKAATGAA